MTAWFSKALCRLFGHHWGWPEIYFTARPPIVAITAIWRQCERCGCREHDSDRQAQVGWLPAYQGPVVGFSAPDPKLRAVGEQVKRAMGWQ